MAGKGDKDRTSNRKQYEENYKKIKWGKEGTDNEKRILRNNG